MNLIQNTLDQNGQTTDYLMTLLLAGISTLYWTILMGGKAKAEMRVRIPVPAHVSKAF